MMTNLKEDDISVPVNIDTARVKSYPKTVYIRNKSLLKLVAAMNCQMCGFHQAQAAHSNWHGGKGRGIKASDNYIAALCQKCHRDIDQGSTLTKQERMHYWHIAHVKTLHFLCLTNQWPKNVPLTDLYTTEIINY